jgi:hypothetical protein
MSKIILKKMRTGRKIQFTAVLVLCLSTVLFFQNCSQNMQQESTFSSMSQASTIEQQHGDQSHGTEVPTAKPEALIEQTSMMDRQMLISMFSDILGPTATTLPGMKKIIAQKSIFGGPCSLYDNFKTLQNGAPKADTNAISCNNTETADNLSAPIQPTGNVLQQAVINDVCMQAMAESKKIYPYFIAQIKDKPADKVPANTSANVLKLFSLFYRGKPLPQQSLVEGLQALVGSPATDAGWQKAFIVTCLSSHWQAL